MNATHASTLPEALVDRAAREGAVRVIVQRPARGVRLLARIRVFHGDEGSQSIGYSRRAEVVVMTGELTRLQEG
ncbi:MAG: hypothetical protein HY574_08755 [candidate division NC10 bacterium]|nr:hypothetical protein [candidate division NC10 bacterium]